MTPTTLTLIGLPNIKPNKYLRWYCNIIDNRIQHPSFEGYGEAHHIIPRSMGGGDIDVNLVKLTAREHFVCHLLLTKFTTGDDNRKMCFALHSMRMCNDYTSGRRFSSWAFKYTREQYVVHLREYLKANSPFRKADVHRKCVSTRSDRGTNVFVTNNPMLNEETKALKVAKTSGDQHYTKSRVGYYNTTTGEYRYFADAPPNDTWVKQGRLKGVQTKAKGVSKPKISCPICNDLYSAHTLQRHIKARHENIEN